MSNMKMVALIDNEVTEAKTEAREDLEHLADAVADEVIKLNATLDRMKVEALTLRAVVASAEQMIAEQKFKIETMRRDVDVLMSRSVRTTTELQAEFIARDGT